MAHETTAATKAIRQFGLGLVSHFELLNISIGWGAGQQSSRLVQGKGSNPIKVSIKENKVIYQKYQSAKLGSVSYCH